MLVIDSFKIKLLKLHISFLESIIIIIMKEKKTLSFALLISNSHSLILDRWTPAYPYKINTIGVYDIHAIDWEWGLHKTSTFFFFFGKTQKFFCSPRKNMHD